MSPPRFRNDLQATAQVQSPRADLTREGNTQGSNVSHARHSSNCTLRHQQPPQGTTQERLLLLRISVQNPSHCVTDPQLSRLSLRAGAVDAAAHGSLGAEADAARAALRDHPRQRQQSERGSAGAARDLRALPPHQGACSLARFRVAMQTVVLFSVRC